MCFLKYNFYKYDLPIITYQSAFVIYGAWFVRINFFCRGACSSKIDKNTFSKDA